MLAAGRSLRMRECAMSRRGRGRGGALFAIAIEEDVCAAAVQRKLCAGSRSYAEMQWDGFQSTGERSQSYSDSSAAILKELRRVGGW